MTTVSPGVAALLSLILPGLGQLSKGERAKGLAILCIALGLVAGILLSTVGPDAFRSQLTPIALGALSPFIWIPAVIDASQRASDSSVTLLSGGKVWYVILMLLAVGPMALPMLWQSPRFSRSVKLFWTVGVILLAVLAIFSLVVIGPALEALLDQVQAQPLLP